MDAKHSYADIDQWGERFFYNLVVGPVEGSGFRHQHIAMKLV